MELGPQSLHKHKQVLGLTRDFNKSRDSKIRLGYTLDNCPFSFVQVVQSELCDICIKLGTKGIVVYIPSEWI